MTWPQSMCAQLKDWVAEKDLTGKTMTLDHIWDMYEWLAAEAAEALGKEWDDETSAYRGVEVAEGPDSGEPGESQSHRSKKNNSQNSAAF